MEIHNKMEAVKSAIRAALPGIKDITRLPADSLYDFLQPECGREQFRRAFQEVLQPAAAKDATSAAPEPPPS